MIDNVNGLPVSVFIVLVGIGAVLLAWVLLRFGGKIAKFSLTLAGLVLAGVVSLAALTQAGANFEQSRATVEIAQVAQTNASGQMLLVGLVGCVGGFAVLAVVILAAGGVYLWWRTQKGNQVAQMARAQRHQAVLAAEQPTPVMAGGFDLSWLDNDNWVAQGEQLWQSNDSLHW